MLRQNAVPRRRVRPSRKTECRNSEGSYESSSVLLYLLLAALDVRFETQPKTRPDDRVCGLGKTQRRGALACTVQHLQLRGVLMDIQPNHTSVPNFPSKRTFFVSRRSTTTRSALLRVRATRLAARALIELTMEALNCLTMLERVQRMDRRVRLRQLLRHLDLHPQTSQSMLVLISRRRETLTMSATSRSIMTALTFSRTTTRRICTFCRSGASS